MLLGTVIDGSDADWPGLAAEARVADRETIQRVAEGDADALALVYDQLFRAVFGLAMRIMQDQSDAEDVVHAVFSQAWSQATHYDATRGSVAAWLLSMARTRAIDTLRSKRAQPESASPPDEPAVVDLPDPAVGGAHRVLAAESVARLRAALAALPVPQRIAIELTYFEGLTQTQVAGRLEQPLVTVTTLIRTGLLTLREALPA